MKVILKKPIYISRFGITFPVNEILTVFTYGDAKLIEHPTKAGLLTNLPKKYINIDTYYKVVKHFPIEGREDFFKYVVVNNSGGICKDFENKEMYFEPWQLENAEKVRDSLVNVELLNKKYGISS